jgi:DNA-binding CsgD family transcriptional regulator
MLALTPRQREVDRLTKCGLIAAEIGRRLGIKKVSVAEYRRRIRRRHRGLAR